MTMFYPLTKLISKVLTILMLFLSLTSGAGVAHEAKKPDELKTTFSVLSDCHIEGLDKEFTFIDTYKVFSRILDDASKMEGGNDAAVFLGDNTMNGQHIENLLFFGAVDTVKPAEKIIVAAGNHDLSNGEGTYEEFKQRFLGYNNAFFTDGIAEPYFYNIVDGSYIICLSSEDATVDTMYLSDTQLEWLRGLLDEASAAGAPIFVMAHHPATYLEGRDVYDLVDLLNDYDNLLYFCGHTHEEFSESSVYTVGGVNCINLPRCTEYKSEGYDTGIGAQVEVYEDEVVVRIRDFYDGKWVEGAEYTYAID